MEREEEEIVQKAGISIIFIPFLFASLHTIMCKYFLYRPPKKKNKRQWFPLRARNPAPANGGIINSKLPLTQSKQMLLHINEGASQGNEIKWKRGEQWLN